MTLMMALNYLLQYLVPDPHEVIEFLVERHNYLQDQAWKAQKGVWHLMIVYL